MQKLPQAEIICSRDCSVMIGGFTYKFLNLYEANQKISRN